MLNFSDRRVSTQSLQRADQLAGWCWGCQLWCRLSISIGWTENWPPYLGRTAHAQWPWHGTHRPCHWGYIQDGQVVKVKQTVAAKKRRKKWTKHVKENKIHPWVQSPGGSIKAWCGWLLYPVAWPFSLTQNLFRPLIRYSTKTIVWVEGHTMPFRVVWHCCQFQWDCWSLSQPAAFTIQHYFPYAYNNNKNNPQKITIDNCLGSLVLF